MELSTLPEEYGRIHWLNERRKGIGGSDVAPILGLSRWEDSDEWSVFLKKRRQAAEKPSNLAMDLGLLLEPVVTTIYERRTGRQCLNPGKLVEHPQHPCLIGSPDRLIVGERRGLEIKTALWVDADKWGDEGTDQVPMDYLLQCAHYMAVCDIDVWDLACFFMAAREVRIYTINRDRDLEADLIERLVAWWKLRIIDGVEPPPSGSSAYGGWLNRRFPKHVKDKALPATTEFAREVLAHHRASQAIEQWEAEKNRAANAMKLAMGDAHKCKGGNWSVSWTASERKYIDWEKIAVELRGAQMSEQDWSAMIAANTKAGDPSRTLRVYVSNKG